MSSPVEHTLQNRPEEIPKIQSWVAKYASEQGLPAEVRRALDLALLEWVTNVVSYAHDAGGEHRIRFRFHHESDCVRVEIEDEGRPFDPLSLPPVDITRPLEERPVGGLGIHMIRNLMDTVEYRREGNRNIVTLTKRISHA